MNVLARTVGPRAIARKKNVPRRRAKTVTIFKVWYVQDTENVRYLLDSVLVIQNGPAQKIVRFPRKMSIRRNVLWTALRTVIVTVVSVTVNPDGGEKLVK